METVVEQSAPPTLEQIRGQITLIRKAIEEYDNLNGALVEARWKYEMISRKPELGVSRDRPVTAEQIAKSIEAMVAQQVVAEEVILSLTNTSSVLEARNTYLRMGALYQRIGDFRELQVLVAFGAATALDELSKQIPSWSTIPGTNGPESAIDSEIDRLTEILIAWSQRVNPASLDVGGVTTSKILVFPSNKIALNRPVGA